MPPSGEGEGMARQIIPPGALRRNELLSIGLQNGRVRPRMIACHQAGSAFAALAGQRDGHWSHDRIWSAASIRAAPSQNRLSAIQGWRQPCGPWIVARRV